MVTAGCGISRVSATREGLRRVNTTHIDACGGAGEHVTSGGGGAVATAVVVCGGSVNGGITAATGDPAAIPQVQAVAVAPIAAEQVPPTVALGGVEGASPGPRSPATSLPVTTGYCGRVAVLCGRGRGQGECVSG